MLLAKRRTPPAQIYPRPARKEKQVARMNEKPSGRRIM
jgi:hypothetical protein